MYYIFFLYIIFCHYRICVHYIIEKDAHKIYVSTISLACTSQCLKRLFKLKYRTSILLQLLCTHLCSAYGFSQDGDRCLAEECSVIA